MCFWKPAIVRSALPIGWSLRGTFCAFRRRRLGLAFALEFAPLAEQRDHALLARQPFLVPRLLVHLCEQLVRSRVVRVDVDGLLRVLDRLVESSAVAVD